MPTYLLHGFRWSRPSIRIHIASHVLDDCAAEWLVLPSSALALLNSLHTLFDFLPPSPQPQFAAPRAFNAWSAVKLLEQHDAADPVPSQPYAYLGDFVLPVRLGADVGAVIAEYEARRQVEALPPPPPLPGQDGEGGLRRRASEGELRRRERQVGWIGKLRDELEPGGEVGWFVVVCDDEVRGDGIDEEEEEMEVREEERRGKKTGGFWRRK